MQDPRRKNRRRSSIMVVEKSGEKDEILKNTQASESGSKESENANASKDEPLVEGLADSEVHMDEEGGEHDEGGIGHDIGRGSPELHGDVSRSSSERELEDKPVQEEVSDEASSGEHSEKIEEDSDSHCEDAVDQENTDREEDVNLDMSDEKGAHRMSTESGENENEEVFHTAEETPSSNKDGSSKEGTQDDGGSTKTSEISSDRKEGEYESDSGHHDKKRVDFDEARNTEYEVEKDAEKSVPADAEERNIQENIEKVRQENEMKSTLAPGEIMNTDLVSGCDLEKERSQRNVAYEGMAFKRRRFFACFWIQRYFVLTKDGNIKYYRDKNKQAIQFLRTGDLDVVSRADKEHETHRYQIVLGIRGREKCLAFDTEEVRNAWVMKLSEVIRNNREDK